MDNVKPYVLSVPRVHNEGPIRNKFVLSDLDISTLQKVAKGRGQSVRILIAGILKEFAEKYKGSR